MADYIRLVSAVLCLDCESVYDDSFRRTTGCPACGSLKREFLARWLNREVHNAQS